MILSQVTVIVTDSSPRLRIEPFADGYGTYLSNRLLRVCALTRFVGGYSCVDGYEIAGSLLSLFEDLGLDTQHHGGEC